MRKLINGKSIDMGVCYYPEHWDRSLEQAEIRLNKGMWNLLKGEEEAGTLTLEKYGVRIYRL